VRGKAILPSNTEGRGTFPTKQKRDQAGGEKQTGKSWHTKEIDQTFPSPKTHREPKNLLTLVNQDKEATTHTGGVSENIRRKDSPAQIMVGARRRGGATQGGQTSTPPSSMGGGWSQIGPAKSRDKVPKSLQE